MSALLITCLLAQIPMAFGILRDEFGPLSKGFQPVVVRNLSDPQNWPGRDHRNRTAEPGTFTPFAGVNRTSGDDFHQTGGQNGSLPWFGNDSRNGTHPIFPTGPNGTGGWEPVIRRNKTEPLPSFPGIMGNGLEGETARRRIERGVEDTHSPIPAEDGSTDSSSSFATTPFTFPTVTGVFIGEGGLPLQIEAVNQVSIPTSEGVPPNSDVSQGRGEVPLQFERGNRGLLGSTPSTPRPNAGVFIGRGGIPLQFDGGMTGNQNIPEVGDNNGHSGQFGGANEVENWGLPGFPPLPAM